MEDHTTDEKKPKVGHQDSSRDGAGRHDQGNADYCNIPLDAWKNALRRDVNRRFGGTPQDLDQVGKSGW